MEINQCLLGKVYKRKICLGASLFVYAHITNKQNRTKFVRGYNWENLTCLTSTSSQAHISAIRERQKRGTLDILLHSFWPPLIESFVLASFLEHLPTIYDWLYFLIMSLLYSCLNVKELLVWNRRDIWSLSESNGIRTHNYLVTKRTLNHLTKLAKLASLAKWSVWLNGWGFYRVPPEVFYKKKLFLKISKYSQENVYVRVSFQ